MKESGKNWNLNETRCDDIEEVKEEKRTKVEDETIFDNLIYAQN
jgi:hypothetical protein